MSDRHFPFLVAIESDPTRYHGERPARPAVLGRGGTAQLLAHLASDLQALFPGIHALGLATAGALFDQTQVLRPDFPVTGALESLAVASRHGSGANRLISIGAAHGRMPHPALQPDPDIPPAALQLLPVLVSGPQAEIDALAEAMEHRFLAEGQLSAHSALGLQSAFGIGVVHARFMTLNDLLALLNLQLAHLGLAPLWELLDAALSGSTKALTVVGGQGQVFEWDGHAVHCQFESFDAYARRDPCEAGALPARYGDWVREYRQYLLTLGAHGVPVVQHLPGQDTPLEGSFWVESVPRAGDRDASCVTEHALPQLGVIAVSVIDGDRLLNFYPLSPHGLEELHRHIRTGDWACRGFAYPGRLVFDSATRTLAPDSPP